MCGIYMIKNEENDKVYIGQSNDISHRWSTHKTELNANRHVNRHLQNAWNKYGQDSFTFSILEECKKDDLDKREMYYIELYDSYNKGYNLDCGGQGTSGFKHTDEQISKMRRVQNPLVVLQFDMNFNLINRFEGGVSHVKKVLKYTKDCVQRCCEHQGKKITYKDSYWVYEEEYNNEHFSWEKYLNQEWCCEIVREKKKKNQQKIYQYTKERVLIKIWDSFSDVEKAGYTRHAVIDICNHRKGKKTHKGYIWAYENYDWSDGYFDNLDDVYSDSIEKKKKSVLQIDCYGNIISEFKSRTDAAKLFNIDASNISTAIKKHKICCGYFWADKGDNWFTFDREYLINTYNDSLNNSYKEVKKIDLNGNFVCSYNSRTDAAKDVGASVGNISRAISEHRICKGFYWE